MQRKPPRRLESFIEAMCWSAYRTNPQLELEDLRQDVWLAFLRAEKSYDPGKGKWLTYAIEAAKHTLFSRRNRSVARVDYHDLAVSPDDFFDLDVETLQRVPLSPNAFKLLRGALQAERLKKCSLSELRRSLRMTFREFKAAQLELRNKYYGCTLETTV